MHNSTHNRNILGTLGNCKHRNVNKFTFCKVIAVELGALKQKMSLFLICSAGGIFSISAKKALQAQGYNTDRL